METNTTSTGTGVALEWDENRVRRNGQLMAFIEGTLWAATVLQSLTLLALLLAHDGFVAPSAAILLFIAGEAAAVRWLKRRRAKQIAKRGRNPVAFLSRAGLLDLRPGSSNFGFLAWDEIKTIRARSQFGVRALIVTPRSSNTVLARLPPENRRTARMTLRLGSGSFALGEWAGPLDDVLNARIAHFQCEAFAAATRPEDSDAASVTATLPERPLPSSAAARTRRR